MFKPKFEQMPRVTPEKATTEQDPTEEFAIRRKEILERLFPDKEKWEDRETYYEGEKTTVKEVLEKNPEVFALQTWRNGDVVWEKVSPGEAVKFWGSETLNGVETRLLKEKIRDTLTQETLDVIESVEFIDEWIIKGRALRGENAMGILSGQGKIRLYEHDLSDYEEEDIEGKMYELLVSAFHEIAHTAWRSLMFPRRLKSTESPKGIEGQITGSEDREKWFNILMTKRGNKLLKYVEETLFQEGTPYEYSDKLEECWCHVFAQAAIIPETLEKFPPLKDLMGKYIMIHH